MRTLVFILILMPTCAFAVNDFKCTVKTAVSLEKDGQFKPDSLEAKMYIGREFVVERSTGRITGGDFNNHMSGVQPTVYDYLPTENSYKAITIYKPNGAIDLLKIDEYEKGKLKPFIFKPALGRSIMGGTCTYY